MKKRMVLMAAAVAVGAVLWGCGSNTSSSETEGSKAEEKEASGETTAEASKEAPADQLVISIGYVNNPGEPIDLACQEWARLLEEKTNGAMKLELYPSSQLGSMTDVYDMAMANDAVIAYGHGGYYADLGVSELNAMYAPYLIKNWDEFDRLMESDWMKEQIGKVEEIGLKVVSHGWHYGIRQTLTKKELKSLDDLKGLKIRIPNSTAQILGYSTLGATPTPMNLSECYTAISQGTIDGMDNPTDVLYGGAYYEVAPYLTITNHMFNDASWSVGKGFFDSLTEEQQTALLETGEEATAYFNKIAEKSAADATEEMKKKGVTVTEIDLGNTEEKTQEYFAMKEFSDWPDDLYDTLKAEMAQ